VATILVLVGASLLLFLVLKAAPSDERRMLRLDQSAAALTAGTVPPPAPTGATAWAGEFGNWLGGAAVGDFGTSHALQKGRPASDLIWPATLRSFLLLAAGLSIALSGALAVSISRFVRPQSRFRLGAEAAISLVSAIPVFLYVYAAVAGGNRFISFGVAEGWWSAPDWFPLPIKADFIPWLFAAVILAVGDAGLMDLVQRFRSEMVQAGSGEYMTGVRVQGLSVPGVVARGFIPGALSHLSRRISFLLGSLVVLEAALGWPGIGYLAWRAAAERDMPVLLGAALVMAVALRLAYMAADFIGHVADPRRRVGR
jgi:peptide/nickel transport system permease protein